mmetsp:Transcript_8962/g.20338  ORF Transcript_8962/g.20338 Transcript_8962/m.20338 type:complete len:224 (+) Transcript_8962:90-761(+)
MCCCCCSVMPKSNPSQPTLFLFCICVCVRVCVRTCVVLEAVHTAAMPGSTFTRFASGCSSSTPPARIDVEGGTSRSSRFAFTAGSDLVALAFRRSYRARRHPSISSTLRTSIGDLSGAFGIFSRCALKTSHHFFGSAPGASTTSMFVFVIFAANVIAAMAMYMAGYSMLTVVRSESFAKFHASCLNLRLWMNISGLSRTPGSGWFCTPSTRMNMNMYLYGWST